MGDFDRNRFYPKKKYISRDANTFGSRFFNNKNGGPKETDKADGRPKSIKHPTILIKTREHNANERSASPKGAPKEFETPSTSAHSSTFPDASNKLKKMTKSIKFLEDETLYVDKIQEYLEENSDFLVVGIVGVQGVGKSTILNLLAQNEVTEKVKKGIFSYSFPKSESDQEKDAIERLTDVVNSMKMNEEYEEAEEQEAEEIIFKLQTATNIENNAHSTNGIDFFITQNRIMFLDCQPFFSNSVLDELIASENKTLNMINEFMSPEINGEITALQLTTFIMSVCHVVILVQDFFFDSNIIRFIQSAEMLKPTISNPEDELADHFPHLILVHNKAVMDDFSPLKFKQMQEIYRRLFNKTKMHIDSGLGIGSGRIINSLSPANCGNPINLFLIPEYQELNHLYRGHPTLEELIDKFRANVLGAAKFQLAHVNLTEKNWVVYCSKVWDHVKKSNFFVEYAKLMP